MTVVKGFNSDVCFHGHSYHVQTEDWGRSKSSVVTKVFKNGAVIKTVVSCYEDLIKENSKDYSSTDGEVEDSIRFAMQTQHHQILNLLHSGQLFHKI